ncbi:TcdA/TcdB catalytic glycosyltransferase domain-containing protein, partial [Saccharopolyspora shandongensis]|uniref:TcdA/TcdB catalytic glycosyltransferase domain-containing protein n=1 Tax=Saccharopolyspora shandongensis TaxID=418495 RepID=UPI0034164888
MWKIAEALDEAAEDLDGVVDGLVAALNEVTRNVDETVGRAFWRYGEKLTEQPAFYAGGARDLAAMAREFSLIIQAAKISIIVQSAFAATEIIRMWVDPFEWPLIGPFIGMMRSIIELIFHRLGQGIAKALQTVVRVSSGFAGKTVDSAALGKGTKIAGSVVSGMTKQAIDEGMEEVVEDGIVQTWQKIESDKGWDWKNTIDSFKYGAAAGAFADALGSAVKNLKPGLQGKALTAGAIEMLTEAFVGAITLPEGGSPGDIWKGMINGAASGAGMAALHNWKNSHEGSFKGEKLDAPGSVNIDGGEKNLSSQGPSAKPDDDAGSAKPDDGAGSAKPDDGEGAPPPYGEGAPPPYSSVQNLPGGSTNLSGGGNSIHSVANGTTTGRPDGSGSDIRGGTGGTAGQVAGVSPAINDSGANAPGSGTSDDGPVTSNTGETGTTGTSTSSAAGTGTITGNADTGLAGLTVPVQPNAAAPSVQSATSSSSAPVPTSPAGQAANSSSANSSSAATNTPNSSSPESAAGASVSSQNTQDTPSTKAESSYVAGQAPPSTAVEAPDMSSTAPLSAGPQAPNANATATPPSNMSATPGANTTTQQNTAPGTAAQSGTTQSGVAQSSTTQSGTGQPAAGQSAETQPKTVAQQNAAPHQNQRNVTTSRSAAPQDDVERISATSLPSTEVAPPSVNPLDPNGMLDHSSVFGTTARSDSDDSNLAAGVVGGPGGADGQRLLGSVDGGEVSGAAGSAGADGSGRTLPGDVAGAVRGGPDGSGLSHMGGGAGHGSAVDHQSRGGHAESVSRSAGNSGFAWKTYLNSVRNVLDSDAFSGSNESGVPVWFKPDEVVSQPLRGRNGVIGVTFVHEESDVEGIGRWGKSVDTHGTVYRTMPGEEITQAIDKRGMRPDAQVPAPWRADYWSKGPIFVDAHASEDTFELRLRSGTTVDVDGKTFAGVLRNIEVFRKLRGTNSNGSLVLLSCHAGAGPSGASFAAAMRQNFGFRNDIHEGLGEVLGGWVPTNRDVVYLGVNENKGWVTYGPDGSVQQHVYTQYSPEEIAANRQREANTAPSDGVVGGPGGADGQRLLGSVDGGEDQHSPTPLVANFGEDGIALASISASDVSGPTADLLSPPAVLSTEDDFEEGHAAVGDISMATASSDGVVPDISGGSGVTTTVPGGSRSHWPVDISDTGAWREVAESLPAAPLAEVARARLIVEIYHGKREIDYANLTVADEVYDGIVDLVAYQLTIDKGSAAPERNAVQLAIYLRGAFGPQKINSDESGPDVYPKPKQEVFPALNEKRELTYFATGQLWRRPLTDGGGRVLGVTFQGDGDLAAADIQRYLEGPRRPYYSAVKAAFAPGAYIPDENRLVVPAPQLKLHEWGESFTVAAHGRYYQKVRFGVAEIVVREGDEPAIERRRRVGGEVLARAVLSTPEFQAVAGLGRLSTINLVTCDAARDRASGVAADFYQVMRSFFPSVVVNASTHQIGMGAPGTAVFQGGTVVTFGGSSPGHRPSLEDVLEALDSWGSKREGVRKHYAAELPLFSVVDRAYVIRQALLPGLRDHGVLDLVKLRELVEAGAGAGNTDLDLVWVAVLRDLRRTPDVQPLKTVVAGREDPDTGLYVQVAVPESAAELLELGPTRRRPEGGSFVSAKWASGTGSATVAGRGAPVQTVPMGAAGAEGGPVFGSVPASVEEAQRGGLRGGAPTPASNQRSAGEVAETSALTSHAGSRDAADRFGHEGFATPPGHSPTREMAVFSSDGVVHGLAPEGEQRYDAIDRIQKSPLVDGRGRAVGVEFAVNFDNSSLQQYLKGPAQSVFYATTTEEAPVKAELLPVPAPQIRTGKWGESFTLAAHGYPPEIRPGHVQILIGESKPTTSRPIGVRGSELARIMMRTPEFQAVAARGRLHTINLVVCYVARDHNSGVAAEFYRTVRSQFPGVVVNAPTHEIATIVAGDRNILLVKDGTLITLGGQSPGHDPTLDEVLGALQSWHTIAEAVRSHYAAELPLFSVVARAFALQQALLPDLRIHGVLNLLRVLGLPAADAEAENAGLVWKAALESLHRDPQLPPLRSVITGLIDPKTRRFVPVPVPADAKRLVAVGPEIDGPEGYVSRAARWATGTNSTSSQAIGTSPAHLPVSSNFATFSAVANSVVDDSDSDRNAEPYSSAAGLVVDLGLAAVTTDLSVPTLDPLDPDEVLLDAPNLGPDVFGLRGAPDVPEFLAGWDYSVLDGAGSVEFLSALDLAAGTRPARGDMALERFATADAGLSVVVEPTMDARESWGFEPDLPPLPEKLEFPRLMHAIWLGGPLRESGTMQQFRENFGAAATRNAAKAQSVLWTDVPRRVFEAAVAGEVGFDGLISYDDVRSMARWAQENRVRLVNVAEVFNRSAPMELQEFYSVEMDKQTGPGYAAASDILRLEILLRFGGIYTDGDNEVGDLPTDADFLGTRLAFAMPPTYWGNSAFAMPKNHPFLHVYLDEIRRGYRMPDDMLLTRAPKPYLGDEETFKTAIRRKSVMYRTGPDALKQAADTVGLLANIWRIPKIDYITLGSGVSWLKQQPRPMPVTVSRAVSLDFTMRVVQTLVRDLVKRDGDLHLAGVADAVMRHPQPGLVWNAAVEFIASVPAFAGRVSSVTDGWYVREVLSERPDRHGAHLDFYVQLPDRAREFVDYDPAKREFERGRYRAPGRLRTPDEVGDAGLDGATDAAIVRHERPAVTQGPAYRGTNVGTIGDFDAGPDDKADEQQEFVPNPDFNPLAPAELMGELDDLARGGTPAEVGLFGPDLFGVLQPGAKPEFWGDLDVVNPPAHQIAGLFSLLDMARPGPVDVAQLDAADGRVLVSERFGDQRTLWSPAGDGVPPLPAVLELPPILHTIWLGGPLTDSGPTAEVRRNIGGLMSRVDVSGQVVLWTDVPRSTFEAARAGDPELAKYRDMLRWAADNDVRLVNFGEVFHEGAEMRLHGFFLGELNKRTGPGYAAASDILRLEVLRRFGGVYSDGDNEITSLSQIFDVLDTREAYALHVNDRGNASNAAFVMSRRHPVADLLLDRIAGQYEKKQADLFPSRMALVPRFFATPMGLTHSRSVMFRTGPIHLTGLMRRLGYREFKSMPQIRGISMGSARSWLNPPADAAPLSGRAAAVDLAVAVVHNLVRSLYNRNGDLHLTEVESLVRKHERPDVVWEAALGFLASRPELAAMVETVTDRALLPGGRGIRDVELPAGASKYLQITGDRVEVPDDRSAERPTAGKWWLGEQARAARMGPLAPAELWERKFAELVEWSEKGEWVSEAGPSAEVLAIARVAGVLPPLDISTGGDLGEQHRQERFRRDLALIAHVLAENGEQAAGAFAWGLVKFTDFYPQRSGLPGGTPTPTESDGDFRNPAPPSRDSGQGDEDGSDSDDSDDGFWQVPPKDLTPSPEEHGANGLWGS